MMKLLHSADWHLGAPLLLRDPEQAQRLRHAQMELPATIGGLCREHDCQLLLLSGDLFDGTCSRDVVQTVKQALEDVRIPVFISPGNHDCVTDQSPWKTELWPSNVHIFLRPEITSVALPELDCRVYGAAFLGADADAMLAGFRAEGPETVKLGVLHGDPTQSTSPYCPITAQQIADSGLDYLALGHIHKPDRLVSGGTLCAWPGNPMGRGFDELGERGVLIVTVDGGCEARFLGLDTPRFYDWECEVGDDPSAALGAMLPAVGNLDFYRIALTGESTGVDLAALAEEFSRFPNLTLRDRTVMPLDLWANAGEDTLEGVYFHLLRQAMEGKDEETCRRIRLAAKISRQLLEGREVKLP